MKALGFHDRLAARPVSDVAPADERRGPAAAAIPQWRELRLPPWAALAVILAAITVALCEPSGLARLAQGAGRRRNRALRRLCHRPGGNWAMASFLRHKK